ncbi:hypothetical protein [Pyxidicoccus sp. MSG2]|uniref:hypothetical protein n=1 Tax=Pyxidicoccus sp. MSG2 TaxID=2996790 RepID=UPI0022713DA1|nr:hypothetical protein [Pyxidicoccus sp. MSG2]MCY1024062.1 hypothetical protein [Pyxidicoccus sp. MSG2]
MPSTLRWRARVELLLQVLALGARAGGAAGVAPGGPAGALRAGRASTLRWRARGAAARVLLWALTGRQGRVAGALRAGRASTLRWRARVELLLACCPGP